jgi:MFS family permease
LCGVVGYVTFGFVARCVWPQADHDVVLSALLDRLIVTPVVYLWARGIYVLLFAVGVSGCFILGIFAWLPIWLPELFPTRMRATAAGFIFNTPRLISAIAPLIAGSLIVNLGGYGRTATILALFYILGLIAVPFLPETKGKPLAEADMLSAPDTAGEELRQTA